MSRVNGRWAGLFGGLVFDRPGSPGTILTLRNAALIALAVFVFVAVRPNLGVRHDGILYAAQALFRLQPEIFGGDVFFKFGSQESFTLFGRLYAAAIGQLGFAGATMFLVALGQLAFFVATLLWCRTALPAHLVFAGLLAVCISAGGYGGMMIFHYAEPFVTARPLAEALVVAGLPFLLLGKRWIALALMLGAATLHPLMALPALALWWAWQVGEDRRWLWLGLAGVGAAVVLALLGVGPFAGLAQRHDAEWRAAIETHTPHVYVFSWLLTDYMMLATDVVLLLWARQIATGPLRKLAGALVIVSAGLLLVSVAGADLLSNVLVTSLQLWRVQWLLHFGAMSLAPLVLVGLLRGGNVQILCGLLLAYAALSRGLVTGGVAVATAAVLGLLARRRETPIEGRLVVMVGLALAGAMLVMWGKVLAPELRHMDFLGGASAWVDALVTTLRKPPLGPLIAVLAFAAAAWRWPRSAVSSLAAVAVAGFMVATLWDQRPAWTRVMEQYAAGDHPFARHIDPQEEVYWSDQPLAPWLMLHRRTYVSSLSTSSMPFNRESAQRIMQRSKVLALFEFQGEVCDLFNSMKGGHQDTCEPDLVTIRTACEADDKLSWIITAHPLESAWRDAWRPGPQVGTDPTYYLYGCRDLLAAAKGTARNPANSTHAAQ